MTMEMAPVLVAAGLGALVGLERQLHQGMAGLRTNALVAAAVISGIGFLGAGVILREGMNVRG